MGIPSVKTIETRLGVDSDKAKRIRSIMDGTTDPLDYPRVRETWNWHDSRLEPRRKMLAIDVELGGFGVESIRSDRPGCSIDYINMGDTYTATVLLIGGVFRIGDWGSIVERHSSRYAD